MALKHSLLLVGTFPFFPQPRRQCFFIHFCLSLCVQPSVQWMVIFLKSIIWSYIQAFSSSVSHIFTLTYRPAVCHMWRAHMPTPVLRQSIHRIWHKFNSCFQTGRPHRSKVVSLSKLLESANNNIQIDFMWFTELTCPLIIHIIGVTVFYSKCVLVKNKEISSVI